MTVDMACAEPGCGATVSVTSRSIPKVEARYLAWLVENYTWRCVSHGNIFTRADGVDSFELEELNRRGT